MRSLRLYPILLCLTLLGLAFGVLLAGRGESIVTTATTNLDNIMVFRRLFNTKGIGLDFVETIDLNGRCNTYVRVVAYLLQPDISAEDTLQAIMANAPCWSTDRQQLLALQQSESLWELGRHTEACNLLQSLQAGSQAVRLLKRSFDQEDFAAVEAYLACLPAFDQKRTWISPYIVSQVYYGLGQYYERQGDLEHANAAYQEAAERYPVVWAAPYIARANLLWQQGQQDLAISSLSAALSRSTDATATFNLWLQLAIYWEEQGKVNEALCAYLGAQEWIDKVPTTNTSAKQRADIAEHIRLLSSQNVGAGECSHMLTAP